MLKCSLNWPGKWLTLISMLRRELIEGLKAGSTHDPKNISFYHGNALIKWSLLQNKMICGLNIPNIRRYTPLYTYVISVVLIGCLMGKSSKEAKEKQIFCKSSEPWSQTHILGWLCAFFSFGVFRNFTLTVYIPNECLCNVFSYRMRSGGWGLWGWSGDPGRVQPLRLCMRQLGLHCHDLHRYVRTTGENILLAVGEPSRSHAALTQLSPKRFWLLW